MAQHSISIITVTVLGSCIRHTLPHMLGMHPRNSLWAGDQLLDHAVVSSSHHHWMFELLTIQISAWELHWYSFGLCVPHEVHELKVAVTHCNGTHCQEQAWYIAMQKGGAQQKVNAHTFQVSHVGLRNLSFLTLYWQKQLQEFICN